MTLNQIVKRIETLSLGHKQVRTFKKGRVTDFFADKTTKYPAVCLQEVSGSISLSGHVASLSYRMFLADLIHVSQDTKSNEQDVQSDMVSIAMDLLAQMNNPNYDDWKISSDNSVSLFTENENDLQAGCIIDFTVSFIYTQNICQVPTDITDYIPTDNDMKFVYDIKYITTGAEGNTLSVPEIVGKKVLFITRESSPLYKVSNSPTGSEYIWNDIVVTLGAAVSNAGERFLILYRNY